MQQTEFFIIFHHIIIFILKKVKKTPGDMIILHMCTKNHDHRFMCYTAPEAWHLRDEIFTFHFGLFFGLLPQQPKKLKLKKKKKTPGDIIILHMYTKNYDHMMYSSSDMVHNEQTDGWKK